ncbi:MAG: FtsX-like permease family protein, partial [Bacilli bacterium]
VAAMLILCLSGNTLSLVGQSMGVMLTIPTIIKLFVIIFVLYIIASIIPSYLFSKIPLSTVFRRYKESKNQWKKALLFLQFFITAVLLFFLIIVVRQYNTIINNDPGYAYENLVHCNVSDVDNTQLQTCINLLESEAFIDQVGASYELPYEGYSGNNIYLAKPTISNTGSVISDNDLFNIADGYSTTENFYEIFEIPFIEGRAPKTENEIAVSEFFVKRMNEFVDWSDGIIGKTVGVSEHGQPFTICGIFKDYVVGDNAFPDGRPIVHFWSELNSSREGNLLIKFKNINSENIAKVEQILKDNLQGKSIEIKIASDDIKAQMTDFIKLRQSILIGGIFSLLITIMGLIGYTEDETARRSAEIAIRKINGAKIYQILEILIKDILKVALVSIILASVLSIFAARNLLDLFAVKTSLNPFIFIFGGLAILFIIIVVVIIKSINVAHQNPVEAIKSE